MNRVLGGFKNMLRQWRINIKRKKVKEKKDKCTKSKSFAYSLLAILYAPFGYLFNFNNKRKKATKLKLEPLFKEIELKLDHAPLEEDINIEKIEQKVDILRRKIVKTLPGEKKEYYQTRLKKVVIKKDNYVVFCNQYITNSTGYFFGDFFIENPRLWSLYEPELYEYQIEIIYADGEKEKICGNFGFRTLGQNGKNVIVNDKPVYIRGYIRGAKAHDHANLLGLSLKDFYLIT